MGKRILAAMAAVLAAAPMAAGQQWVAPRVAQRSDPWIQPAAAYQPAGRAYAIDDSFAGQAPMGSGFLSPQPAGPTYVPGESELGPLSVGTPNYYQSPPAAGQTYIQPGLAQPSMVAPSWGQQPYCQPACPPACPPGLMTQPCDPYAYYATPVAPIVTGVGFQRRPFAELEGRMGDNPNSLHGNLFLPFMQQADSFWFADIRGQWDDDDAREYNAGVAWRRLYGDIIVGLYGFYDYRETRFDNEFHGATVGAEALDLNWEARLNWYIPEGGGKATGQGAAASLVNNAIVVQNNIERAYYGFDAEVGRLLWRGGGLWDAEVRGFVGGYYFNNHAAGFNSFGGPRGRLEARLYDLPRLGVGSRFTLGATVQYDEFRDLQGIASVNLRIPFGSGAPQQGGKLSPIERRMLSPIRRDDDIITRTGLGTAEQALLVGNGDDGRVLNNITEVNAATADVTTAVASGTSNVVVTGNIETNATIVLNEGQFLGGTFAVRGQTTGRTATFGARPTINATGANAVQIADNSIVAGLNITGNQSGIVGGADDTRLPADADALADGVNNFTINNNTITAGGFGSAIDLDGTINGDITGNQLAAGDDGLNVEVFQSGLVSGNSATDDGTGDDGFDFADITGGAVSGNTATGWGSDGFELGTLSGGALSGNTSSANQAHGFFVSGTLSGGAISGNTASGNQAEGFDLDTIDGASITDNRSTGNGDDGFDFDGGMLSGVIASNTATGNANDGFEFSGALTGGVVDNNTATGNNTAEAGVGEGGFGGFNFFDPTNGGAGGVTLNGTAVTNNTSMNNGLDGFAFDEVQSGLVQNNTSTGDNTAFDLGGNGGFSFLDVTGGTINGNTATGGGGDGFVFFNSVSGGTISNNTATSNAFDGFDFVGAGGASLAGGTLSGNTATGNGDDGFEFGAPITAGTINGTNMATGNGVGNPATDDDDGNGLGDGFFFADINGANAAAVTIDSNVSTGNTDDGFHVGAFNGAGTFTNNAADMNGGLGFNPAVFPGAIVTGGNTAAGNTGGDGTP